MRHDRVRASTAAQRGGVRMDCLAERGVEGVVQATELEGVAQVDARRAVGEDLDSEP